MPTSILPTAWLPTLTVSGGKVRVNISDLAAYGLVAAEAHAVTGDYRKILWALLRAIEAGKVTGMPPGMTAKVSTSYVEGVWRSFTTDFVTEHSVHELAAEVSTAPPVITVNPVTSVELAAGEDLELVVVASGATTYQWLFNGIPIVGQTNATLTVVAVDGDDDGVYRVKVSNPYGSVVSSPTSVVITFPPVITIQPSDLFILAELGSTGSGFISLEATGTSPLAYQWQRSVTDPGIGATWVNVTSTGSGITVTHNFGAATVWYRCVVTNAHGTATSDPAEVTTNDVADPAEIVTDPSNQYRVVEYSAPADVLSLNVNTAGSGTLTHQWKRALLDTQVGNLTTSKNLTTAGSPTYPAYDAIVELVGNELIIISQNYNVFHVNLLTGNTDALAVITSTSCSFASGTAYLRQSCVLGNGVLLSVRQHIYQNEGDSFDARQNATLCYTPAGSVRSYRAGWPRPQPTYLDTGTRYGYRARRIFAKGTAEAILVVVDPENYAGGATYMPRFIHYNYTTDTWTTYSAQVPFRNLVSAHMRADGKILCLALPYYTSIGVTSNPTLNATDLTAHLFDPATDTLTNLGPVGIPIYPANRYDGVLPNGDLVIAGQSYFTNSNGSLDISGTVCMIHRAATGTFERTTDFAHARNGTNNAPQFTTMGVFPETGEAYVCGGTSSIVEILNMESLIWRQAPVTLPTDTIIYKALSDGRLLASGQIVSAVQYQWTNALRLLRRAAGVFTNVGLNSPNLNVSIDQSTPDALYKCAVTNLVGSDISAAALIVVDVSPSFSAGATTPNLTAGASSGTNITVTGTTNVTVSLPGNGDAPLSYRWERSSDGGATWTVLANVVPSFIFSATKIGGVTTYHDFKLTISNPFGSKTSLIATVTVL